jgi:hypothetical protein
MTRNPLRAATADWLPEFDFAVFAHGFAPHGRDYLMVTQVAGAGTYELTLTHVVDLHYETRVHIEVWPNSWDDILTDYKQWEASGQPDGYIWGTNWSNAYPGLELPDSDPVAQLWSDALGKAMFAIELTTDRFKLRLVFHDARWRKLSEDDSTIARVFHPIGSSGEQLSTRLGGRVKPGHDD